MSDGAQYSARLIDALGVAARLHSAQQRKGSEVPYLSHLLGTCSIALDYGADEDEAIAALLHDAIEDVEPVEEARAAVAEFGERVLGIVEGCTDTDQHPKPPGASASRRTWTTWPRPTHRSCSFRQPTSCTTPAR